MAIMKKDKDMKRDDIDFQCTNNAVAVKWFHNRGGMVGTCLEECKKVPTAIGRLKGQTTKIPVPGPEIIKDCSSGVGGVDLLDQKAVTYKLDCKSSDGHYYLRYFLI